MLSRVLSRSTCTRIVVAALTLAPASAFAQDPAAASGGVCVAVMAATMTGVDGDAAEAGAAVRDLFISILTGPSIQPLALQARLRVQAVEEAKQKDCAHILTMAVSRKAGGGRRLGSVLGSAASSGAWYIPGASGAAGVARGVTVGATRAIGDLAASTRAKDELRIEWTLSQVANASRASSPRSEKLKAKSDGEDLLTPLVQHAAEAVAEAVLKK